MERRLPGEIARVAQPNDRQQRDRGSRSSSNLGCGTDRWGQCECVLRKIVSESASASRRAARAVACGASKLALRSRSGRRCDNSRRACGAARLTGATRRARRAPAAFVCGACWDRREAGLRMRRTIPPIDPHRGGCPPAATDILLACRAKRARTATEGHRDNDRVRPNHRRAATANRRPTATRSR